MITQSDAANTVKETIARIEEMKKINLLGCSEIGQKYFKSEIKPTRDELLDQRLSLQIQRKTKKFKDIFYKLEIEAVDMILDIYNKENETNKK